MSLMVVVMCCSSCALYMLDVSIYCVSCFIKSSKVGLELPCTYWWYVVFVGLFCICLVFLLFLEGLVILLMKRPSMVDFMVDHIWCDPNKAYKLGQRLGPNHAQGPIYDPHAPKDQSPIKGPITRYMLRRIQMGFP